MKYRFETFVLDIGKHELLQDGQTVSCEPQVFDILRFLVENAGQLVSQDDLIEHVWKGRIVSDSAISARISAARAALGDDGTKQKFIKTVPRRGFRFVAEIETAEKENSSLTSPDRSEQNSAVSDKQIVRFCKSTDGTNIAFSTMGTGYPLVRAGHWLTHLEHDWQSPVWRPNLEELGNSFSVTRYDQRGNGLSDWDVSDFSLPTFTDDLEAVVDAAGLQRFALYGTSQGAPIAISYAMRHPQRISHLVLHGGYVRGRLIRGSEEEREQGRAILTLIRHSWGKEGSAFLKSFASMYIPEGTKEQLDSLAELQRQTTSPENAALLRQAVDSFDVSELLEKIDIPTLVIHARNDSVQPLSQGRALASGIRNAQFVQLESSNHAILKNEPAWTRLIEELINFIQVK